MLVFVARLCAQSIPILANFFCEFRTYRFVLYTYSHLYSPATTQISEIAQIYNYTHNKLQFCTYNIILVVFVIQIKLLEEEGIHFILLNTLFRIKNKIQEIQK